jgi:hypothetical protein
LVGSSPKWRSRSVIDQLRVFAFGSFRNAADEGRLLKDAPDPASAEKTGSVLALIDTLNITLADFIASIKKGEHDYAVPR